MLKRVNLLTRDEQKDGACEWLFVFQIQLWFTTFTYSLMNVVVVKGLATSSLSTRVFPNLFKLLMVILHHRMNNKKSQVTLWFVISLCNL